MASSSAIDPDVLFTSDEEKSFEFEDGLPSLPVPPLRHTLDRYLDSVKPHLTDDEYRQTEFIVQQFATGVGKDLQDKLIQRGKEKKNWLEQWWTDYAYMDFRLPLGPLLNFGGPAPYLHSIYKPKDGTQIERAAVIFNFSLKFWQHIRKERLRIDRDSQGNRMSMHQFYNAYSTCRIPHQKRDRLEFYFQSESKGDTPRNLLVMCRGRIFSMQCIDSNDEPYTVPELQKQFQFIRDKCDSLPLGPGLGALTGDHRASWAENRRRLIALHPKNYEYLETLQKSVLVCVLDDYSPQSETEVFLSSLAGDSSNRWFDKSASLIVYKNGLCGSCCDHSPWDAMVLVTSTYYNDLSLQRFGGKWQGSSEIREMEEPQELEFVLDDVLQQGIVKAKEVYNGFASNLAGQVMDFESYGKKFIRTYKLHPDSYVQLALQYAYYKKYRRPAPTYETGTTRKFYHARTETVRSCTVEAIDWSKIMLDTAATTEKKLSLFKKAMEKQNKLMAEARENHGCDRHLMGLSILALEAGMPLPELYTDPAYVKSGGNGNFVLSTSFTGYTSVFGGVAPMVENGYGCFYKIEENSINMFISSWKSCAETSAVKFGEAVHSCLTEMGGLIQFVQKESARL